MANINTTNLEKALSGGKTEEAPQQPQMSQEQEIFFHQGALQTLNNERAELFKMVQNVEMVMQAHLKRLEELGVKVPQQEAKK